MVLRLDGEVVWVEKQNVEVECRINSPEEVGWAMSVNLEWVVVSWRAIERESRRART